MKERKKERKKEKKQTRPCEKRIVPSLLTLQSSLRSKRFRLVSEQRNTEEGDFRY